MKYIILVGDGMADEPIDKISGERSESASFFC